MSKNHIFFYIFAIFYINYSNYWLSLLTKLSHYSKILLNIIVAYAMKGEINYGKILHTV